MWNWIFAGVYPKWGGEAWSKIVRKQRQSRYGQVRTVIFEKSAKLSQISRALGVPVVDYTYDDCKIMRRAKEMNLPCATSLVEVQKLRHYLR